MRQRIPVIIRNSRQPAIEGTCISLKSPSVSNGIKAISLKENLAILEIRSEEYPVASKLLSAIRDLCFRKGIEPALLCAGAECVFLGLTTATALDAIQLELNGCVNVHLRTRAALITLVGSDVPAMRSEVTRRVLVTLRNTAVEFLPGDPASLAVQIVVPQSECKSSSERLHREFFQQVDAAAFAPVSPDNSKGKSFVEPLFKTARGKHTMLGRFGLRDGMSA